jgi:hypothetical protein
MMSFTIPNKITFWSFFIFVIEIAWRFLVLKKRSG